MLISETGTSTSKNQFCAPEFCISPRGFSLIEVLVVITIIGIFAGTAILSLDILGSDRQIQREAVRLQTMIQLLADESVMEGRDYGILFSESGYRFYIYDYQRLLWLDPIGDSFLAEHELEEPISVDLYLEDQRVILESEFNEEFQVMPEPQIIIYSSGELTPFKSIFYRGFNEVQFVVTGQINGLIDIAEQV
tara:strand:+ start:42 stop:620 length:579 start_codon:yes stop_codon:yes gene_type:complete